MSHKLNSEIKGFVFNFFFWGYGKSKYGSIDGSKRWLIWLWLWCLVVFSEDKGFGFKEWIYLTGNLLTIILIKEAWLSSLFSLVIICLYCECSWVILYYNINIRSTMYCLGGFMLVYAMCLKNLLYASNIIKFQLT